MARSRQLLSWPGQFISQVDICFVQDPRLPRYFLNISPTYSLGRFDYADYTDTWRDDGAVR